MTNKPSTEMTVDELLAHARSVDDSTARAKEEARIAKMGIKPRDANAPRYSEADHAATAARVAAEEERKKAAEKLPDARTMTDAQFQDALRKLNVPGGLM